MKILYIAKHESGGNDDEGSICHALTTLGHEVVKVYEPRIIRRGRVPDTERLEALARLDHRTEADLLLFHKFDNLSVINRLKMKKVFWYFDLVEYDDPTLEARNQTRRKWMDNVLPHVHLGFCTDGDFVRRESTRSDKLVHLTQGADQRIVFLTTKRPIEFELLFTGIQKLGGIGRISFVEMMRHKYQDSFAHLQGFYRTALAEMIARTKIVVCPDHPITDDYWSNRVYLVSGFGGFLLHSYSRGLAEHYKEGSEIAFYSSRSDLFEKIAYYLKHPDESEKIAEAAYQRTLKQHLYIHRCQTLLTEVQTRLLGGRNCG